MMPKMMPPPMPEKTGNKNEICVPANALSVPEDGGGETPPGVGDTVEFTVSGKVSRTEGGELYVTPTTINGEPVQEAPETPSEQDMDAQEEAGIMDALKNAKEGDSV